MTAGLPVSFCQNGSAPQLGLLTLGQLSLSKPMAASTFDLSALRIRCFWSELTVSAVNGTASSFSLMPSSALGAGADDGVGNLFRLPINHEVLDMPQVFVVLVADIHAEDAAGLVDFAGAPSFGLVSELVSCVVEAFGASASSPALVPGARVRQSSAAIQGVMFLLCVFIELAFVFGSRFVWLFKGILRTPVITPPGPPRAQAIF